MVERIVGDVHLAVDAAEGAVSITAVAIEDSGSVVIDTWRALFKQRRDEDNFVLSCRRSQLLRRRSGDGLG